MSRPRGSWLWRLGGPTLLPLVVGCASTVGSLSFYPTPIFDTRVRRVEPALLPELAAREIVQPVTAAALKTVVVDAGHGGPDPGALGVGPLPEKAVNLSVAMRLARLLAASGIDVVTTRATDEFIPLDGRSEIAEHSNADLFVSIHTDAAPNSEVTGATVYMAPGALPQSRRAADHIVGALKRAGLECRGIRRAGFRVLVGHSRPAVLVECGYLTNYFEAHRLSQPGHQAKVAAAIAEGISNHLFR